MEDSSATGNGNEQHRAHVRHFLDCVRDRRRPVADVEDGHLLATMRHLGNIATRPGRSLRWDPEKEEMEAQRQTHRILPRTFPCSRRPASR